MNEKPIIPDSSFAEENETDVMLASSGKTDYKIVLPSNGDSITAFAAEELSHFFTEATGAKIGTVRDNNAVWTMDAKYLSIGYNKLAEDAGVKADDDVGTSGFNIVTKGNTVFMLGKTALAALYAVYDFLHYTFGYEAYTEDCYDLNRADVVKLKALTVKSIPTFDIRFGPTTPMWRNNLWLRRLRFVTPEEVMMTPPSGDFWATTLDLVPIEDYYDEHPDWFSQKENGVPCLSNGLNDDGTLNEAMPESVVKSVIEEMYADVKAFPDVKVFSLTQEDGADYFDDENNRRLEQKYKRSGLLVRFCNAVVRGVNERAKKELGRTVKIMTFAYHYTKDAPVKYENGEILPIDDTVVADENLVIQFALFSNAAYDYFSKYQDEGISKNMREWRVIAKEFWFWAYDIAFNNFFAFYDSFKNIDANLKGFKDYGITYMCMQGSNDSAKSWQCNARAYAYRQIMNGSKLTARELLDEYLDGYYSVAADEVREVIGLFSDNYAEKLRRGEKINFTTFGNFSNGENNPYDLLVNALKVLETAENKISEKYDGEEKERYLKRIAGVKVTPLDLMYLNYYYYFPNGNEEARANFRERFVETARYAGIDRARERYSLDRYVAFTESEVKEKKEPQPSAESPCE